MGDKSLDYLSRFNQKLLSVVSTIKHYAPDLIIIEDHLTYVVNHGNRELPWIICYDKIYPHRDLIYNEDDKCFEENLIMNELLAFVDNSKITSTDKITQYNNEIRKNINLVKDKWTKETPENKKKIWNELKLMMKLCEFYNKSRT